MSQVAYRGRVKYNETAAQKYQHHKPAKHQAEMRLIDRAFALIPVTHTVLDAPCGTGRVTVHLAAKGYRMRAADLSDAMLALTRETVKDACPVEKQDVERLTYADRQFDTVVCFRLFHHFPNPAIRQRVIAELCRVARKYVVLSYFSPLSYTSAKRALRAKMGGRKSEKHPTPLPEVACYFQQAGFRLVKDFARLPLIHTLHLAVFARTTENTR